jgi:hypothetical protein
MYKPSPFVAHMQKGIIFYAHSQNFHLKFETPLINGNYKEEMHNQMHMQFSL